MITLSNTVPFGLLGFALLFTASAAEPIEVAPGVLQVGTIADPDISESSGLVASKRFRNTYWTHNDSGNNARLFAINREGETLAHYSVVGPNLNIKDWEDIEVDSGGNLYIADIGNNNENRETIWVHKVREPNPRRPLTPVTIRKSWKLRFPNEPKDSEAFFVAGRFGYLISKEDKNASLFRFRLSARTGLTITLEKVGEFDLEAPVTGADLSRDARRLGLITPDGVYLISARRNVLTASATTMSFTPFENDGMEGGGFASDGFLVSSESRELYLFNDLLFRTR